MCGGAFINILPTADSHVKKKTDIKHGFCLPSKVEETNY